MFAADSSGAVWRSYNLFPTFPPSNSPTLTPSSRQPSSIPSTIPSCQPTAPPSSRPSSGKPSWLPSQSPSERPTVAPSEPTFTPSSTPTNSVVNCTRHGINLTSLVTDSNWQRVCFTVYDSNSGYMYTLSIPVCGTPADYCSPFSEGSVSQIGSQSGGLNYDLGSYTESWQMTSYLSQSALSVDYTDGTMCQDLGPRNTLLYILCNRQLNAPSLLVYEMINCSYVIVMQTPDESVCQVLDPMTLAKTPTNGPSDFVQSAPTSNISSSSCLCVRNLSTCSFGC